MFIGLPAAVVSTAKATPSMPATLIIPIGRMPLTSTPVMLSSGEIHIAASVGGEPKKSASADESVGENITGHRNVVTPVWLSENTARD